jgi:hypothetical protein
LGGEIRQRQATQGQLLPVHCLAGDRLDHGFVPRGKKGACAPAQHGLPRQSRLWPSAAATGVPSWDGAAPEPQQRYSTRAAGGVKAGPGWRVAATETRPCVDGPSVPPAQGMRVEKRAGTPAQDQAWEPSFEKSSLDSHGQSSQCTEKGMVM